MNVVYSIDLTEMIAFSVIASIASIVMLALFIKIVTWFIKGRDFRALSVIVAVLVLLTVAYGLILFSSDAISTACFIINTRKDRGEIETGDFSVIGVEEVYQRDDFLGYRATLICAGRELDAANVFSGEEIETLKKQNEARITFGFVKGDLYIMRVETGS